MPAQQNSKVADRHFMLLALWLHLSVIQAVIQTLQMHPAA